MSIYGKNMQRLPVKWVAALILAALLAVSLSSVLYLGFSAAKQNTDELLSVNVELVLDGISARINEHLLPVEHQATQISRAFRNRTVSLDDKAGLTRFLQGVFSASPQISGIGIITPDNRLTAMPRRDETLFEGPWPSSVTYDELIELIREDKRNRWRPPIWSRQLNQAITSHFTVLEMDDKPFAILVQTVPIAELSRFLNLDLLTDGVPFIYYDNDKLVAHPKLISWRPTESSARSGPDNGQIATIPDIGEALLEELVSAEGYPLEIISNLRKSTGKAVNYEDRQYIMFTRTITRYGSQPWTLGFYFDRARADEGIVERLFISLAVGLALLLVSVALAMYAGVRFSGPVRLLARLMLLVRQGAYDQVPELPRSRISELDDVSQSFNEMTKGLRERDLIRKTLGRYVPAKIAEALLKDKGELATEETIATVLFADMEGFTTLTENLGADGIVTLLNEYFSDMVEIIEKHGGVVTQFQGDAILATFNVPIKDPAHAQNAINAALAMRQHNATNTYNGTSVRTRIGVNTGPLVAGAVGAKGRLNYTVHGDAVNLAARLEGLSKEYGTYLLTTQTTLDQAPGIKAELVGETKVRGQSTPVKIYALPEPQPFE